MEREKVVEETIRKYEQYINPAVAKLFRFMGLSTVEWFSQGALITDIHGKEYIDCLGGYGVFSLGHRHPKVIAAVKEQLDTLPMSSKVLFDKPMADLAELMAEITPGDLTYSFFCNSGTEAVEGAIKMARLHTGRNKIIAMKNAFHGKTLGSLSATGRDVFREPFQPLLQGFYHVPFGDIKALENMINEETAAVIIEPIQGEGGIIVPPDDYLGQVRKLCDKWGSVLICDEVQTGMGRTGEMFAVNHYGVVPDIITTAKALGGGIMPIGAFTATPAVWAKFIESPFIHTSTFGGNPLACAAAVATIGVIKDEGLVEKAANSGSYFQAGLLKLQIKYPQVIKEVRGKGLLIGLELSEEGIGGFLMSELIAQGVLVAYTLNNPKVMRVEPPLVIATAQIDYVLNAFENAISKAAEIFEDLVD